MERIEQHTLFVTFTHFGIQVGYLGMFNDFDQKACQIRAREFAERTAGQLLCDSKSDGAVKIVVAGKMDDPPLWSSRSLPHYDDPYKPWRD